jgi:hypothetical protein
VIGSAIAIPSVEEFQEVLEQASGREDYKSVNLLKLNPPIHHTFIRVFTVSNSLNILGY